MLFHFTAAFLIASLLGSQTPIAVQNSPAQTPAPAAVPGDLITVASGITVPLTLITPIKSKSTKPGDTVRAVVAFPVTSGTQLAIPAGTYVEGLVNSITLRAPHTHLPTVQIHFTRLVFANGYTATFNAANTQAMLTPPVASSQPTYEIAEGGAPALGNGFAAEGLSPSEQSALPPLPPLPSNGPSPAMLIGIGAGAAAGILVLTLAFRHHGGNSDYVLFDNGWQFQMALESPLTLDASRVAAAAATPATN